VTISKRTGPDTFETDTYKLNLALLSGKWYYEVSPLSNEEIVCGWDTFINVPRSNLGETVGNSQYSYGYQLDGGFLVHDGNFLQAAVMVVVGETLGCAIDLTTQKISYYKNGGLVGEFHNIRSKTDAPFYPTVSLESSGAFKCSISHSSIKNLPPGYKAISEATPNYTLFRERVDSTLSPVPDTVEFF
jgi:hypothetical protein